MALLGLLLMASQASAADYEVTTQLGVVYAEPRRDPNWSATFICRRDLPRRRPWWRSMAADGKSAAGRFTTIGVRSSPATAMRFSAIEYRLGKPGVYPAAGL